MTRAEYRAERAKVRYRRRMGPPWWDIAPVVPSQAASDAAYATISRQLAIEIRVARNRMRREMEAQMDSGKP